jgi:hypothetical protein
VRASRCMPGLSTLAWRFWTSPGESRSTPAWH